MYSTTHNTTQRTMELYFGNGHRIVVDFKTNLLTVYNLSDPTDTVDMQGLTCEGFAELIHDFEIQFNQMDNE